MPLVHGKSEKAFKNNVETEMHHDKPLKQSLAIAYSMKRKAEQHKAHGGSVEHCAHGGPMECHEGCYAEGGMTTEYADTMGGKAVKEAQAHNYAPQPAELDPEPEPSSSPRKYVYKADGGMMQDAMKFAPLLMAAAEGGMVPDEPHPMVHRIMMSRAKGYSEGGKVANEHSGESTDEPTMAKADGNELDDLALRDDLEANATGANEGDELGDSAEEHDRHDIVSRIMKSRMKKDRLAVPGEGSSYGRRK